MICTSGDSLKIVSEYDARDFLTSLFWRDWADFSCRSNVHGFCAVCVCSRIAINGRDGIHIRYTARKIG